MAGNHTSPEKLTRYSFFWSEARLVIAAVSLIFGATPIVYTIAPFSFIIQLIMLAWIISGLASLYLLYRWFSDGWKVFGGKNKTDIVAFAIMVISGINLGIAGLALGNIGMKLTPPAVFTVVMIITGLVYLWTAYHLWRRWSATNGALFSVSLAAPPAPAEQKASEPSQAPEPPAQGDV